MPTVAGVVARGLDAPWGLAFLPDGSALVSQRDDATIVHVTAGGKVSPVGKVPGVQPQGEAGLLGIAVSPDYASDSFLFAYFSTADGNQVARMTYDASGGLGKPQVLLDGIAKAANHDGGRIAFGPDGMLYVTTGDANQRDAAQDKTSLNGKILRITPDGDVPPDNPFPDSPVWSYGHRNVQGIAWDAAGRMWADEFGQNTWDELNLIKPGNNYGWPVVEGRSDQSRLVNPVAQWPTDNASPSGIAVAGQAVYMAALRGARLWQVPVPGGKAGTPKDYFTGKYGRLRAVALAPDGSLWLMTNNTDGRGQPRKGDDKILRLALA